MSRGNSRQAITSRPAYHPPPSSNLLLTCAGRVCCIGDRCCSRMCIVSQQSWSWSVLNCFCQDFLRTGRGHCRCLPTASTNSSQQNKEVWKCTRSLAEGWGLAWPINRFILQARRPGARLGAATIGRYNHPMPGGFRGRDSQPTVGLSVHPFMKAWKDIFVMTSFVRLCSPRRCSLPSTVTTEIAFIWTFVSHLWPPTFSFLEK